ncbi:MAG: cytochrome c peroxidase [Pseudomonadota bacterium]
MPTLVRLKAVLAVLCLSLSAPSTAWPDTPDAPPALPAPLGNADFLYDGSSPEALVALGRLLFFDPVLSGNRNISCGTCHDPTFGTGDGLALGIGEGGSGAGPDRRTANAVTGRVPRNAQALWNIGARAYTAMFHDGRMEIAEGQEIRSPAGRDLPDMSSLLAAQAFFPVTSPIEMAGQPGENAIADHAAVFDRPAVWQALAVRVAELPGYARLFKHVFEDVEAPDQIAFAHIAEALAAFQTVAFRSDDSPFDAVLRGADTSDLGTAAVAGMALFYGKAGCADCHSGPLLTDHAFHAIAVPQIGPGKGHGADMSLWRETGFPGRAEDEGRYRVTGDRVDLFAFRTPSLRNVALTGPWGHDGAFQTLEAVVRHHLDTLDSLENYRLTEAILPSLDRVYHPIGKGSVTAYRAVAPERRNAFDRRDTWVQRAPHLRSRIAAANDLAPHYLTDAEVDELLAFLDTLTDPSAVDRSGLVPVRVPSGLPPQPTPLTER